MSKRVFKWNDSRKMPVEGSVTATLPDAEFLAPSGQGYVGSESGDQLGDGYPFTLKGAGLVTVVKSAKGGAKTSTKNVPDDTGFVQRASIEGNMTYFNGHMSGGEPFRGYVHAPEEGSGQGEVTIEYKDQRGRVTVSGWLEHELSGAEITGSNAGNTNPLPPIPTPNPNPEPLPVPVPGKPDDPPPPADEKKQAAAFDPADLDRDGDVDKDDKKAQKRLDKMGKK